MKSPKRIGNDLYYILFATMFFGVSDGILTPSLNNYLSDVHALTAVDRGWLELPREFPGFAIMFVSAGLLCLMRETRIAAAAVVLTGIGVAGLGLFAHGAAMLVLFVVVWSLGDHLLLAVEGTIGLNLARSGSEGRRLGQLGGARNLGVIAGVGSIYLLAKTLGDRYDLFYIIAAISTLFAGMCYVRIQAGNDTAPSKRIVLKRKYTLFYVINALFGVRKQIFLVFGGWVLVQINSVPVSTIALLYFISASLSIVVRPLLGDVIDWLGERAILAANEVLLLGICLAYAFAGDILQKPYSLYLLYGAYVLDSILFALRIARITYLKKIADDPADITPTVSMGISIDHIVAMTLPIFSGYVWNRFGYYWVFLIASAFAVVGFFVCLRIRVPRPGEGALANSAKEPIY